MHAALKASLAGLDDVEKLAIIVERTVVERSAVCVEVDMTSRPGHLALYSRYKYNTLGHTPA